MNFIKLARYFERLEATAKRLEMFEILAQLFKGANAQEIDELVYLVQGQLLPAYRGVDMGMSEKLLARALADAAGVSLATVEREFKKNGDLGKTANGLIKGAGRKPSVEEVYAELFKIAQTSGAGSVEKKVSLLSDLLSRVSPLEAKYISRFVIGRLRLGVGDPTVMEALCIAKSTRDFRPDLERAYNLCSDLGFVAKTLFEKGENGIKKIKVLVGYPIRMALCERLPSSEEIISKVGMAAIEAKYDGFRCQVHKSGEDVEIFSRNLERTTHMFPEIVEAAKKYITANTAIFEGEALAYNDETGELFAFQVTMQRKRKHGVEELAKEYPLRCFAFDLLFADGRDYTNEPYEKRREKLTKIIKKNPVIEPSDVIITNNPDEVKKYFESAIERGLEGIVAKRLDAPYAAGARNFNWIKLKRSYKGELADTVDVCIVGYFKGKGLRARFGIGAVLCAVYDPASDSFKTISKVGSGFTEEGWINLRKALDKIARDKRHPRVDSVLNADVWVEPHYVITVTADEITRSPMHTAGKNSGEMGYALRFPRAQEFIREDKRPEDSNSVEEIVKMYGMQKKMKA